MLRGAVLWGLCVASLDESGLGACGETSYSDEEQNEEAARKEGAWVLEA
jgi:hypothetical protein